MSHVWVNKQINFQARGFTLIELIVVIGMMGILITVSIFVFGNVFEKTKAHQMLNDFKQLETAWRLWKVDVAGNSFPNNNGTDTSCPGKPNNNKMSDTPLLSGSNTSYMKEVPREPFFDREYYYDNDDDGGAFTSGVAIVVYYCNASEKQKIEDAAKIIDDATDRGDGATTGKVRWSDYPSGSPVSGRLKYVMSDNSIN